MTAMRPILLRDACVVTMHPALGDLSRGAVLIEGDRIAAVAPDIEAGDAETIDARGFVVIPGLINAHMHTWQTALRGRELDAARIFPLGARRAGDAVPPRRHPHCDAGGRAQSDQLRFDDAG
jgi:cytosine/adenosine deaminase-related metal-dependent hydrolase